MNAPMLRLLRPHQYTKNALIFAAPGAAGRLGDADTLWRTVVAFALFCAVSSAGYVANDLGDVEADRLHPRKRNRPIASGAVSPTTARRMLVGLLAGVAAASPTLGLSFVGTIAGYAIVTFVYTAAFKRIAWLELVAVSSGFVLRAVAGGTATATRLSAWFLIVVSAGALLVITGKRLGELLTLGADTPSRPVLQHYRADALRALAAVAAVGAVAAYAAWAASGGSGGASTDGGTLLRATTLPFIAAIGRYLLLSWRGDGEAPDILVLRDRPMILAGLVWLLLYVIGLYA